MKVIVGLGNPGDEYMRTRHNIGWMIVDTVAAQLGAGRFRRERSVTVAEGFSGGEKFYLVKPQTYMNRSGQALASWLSWFGEISTEIRKKNSEPTLPSPSRKEQEDDSECVWPKILVVTDDVNLPLGRIRFRPCGSAGGHNGLTDIQKTLGGTGYPRLRIGVDTPPEYMDRADYVLASFSKTEIPVKEKVTEKAAGAVGDWIIQGMNVVRHKYNGMDIDDR